MEKFKEWFNNKLTISGYPATADVFWGGYRVLINVSDTHAPDLQQACRLGHANYHWFPMNEQSGDIGLNSIYGALHILHAAQLADQRVLLHCHAGKNRSQTVADAFHFMRTLKHRYSSTPSANNIRLGLKPTHTTATSNALLENCEVGLLLPLPQMEAFLIRTLVTLEPPETILHFGLDYAKQEIKKWNAKNLKK